MLDVGQLAVQGPEALDAHFMLERGGGQQADAQMVSEHVGAGQAQLGVAVQGGFGTADLGAGDGQAGAVFTRVDGGGAGAEDHIAGLVGLGQGRGDGEGEQRGGEKMLTHGKLQSVLNVFGWSQFR
ncbi:hypothetical protein D3C76_1074240 [compost metagenome]